MLGFLASEYIFVVDIAILSDWLMKFSLFQALMDAFLIAVVAVGLRLHVTLVGVWLARLPVAVSKMILGLLVSVTLSLWQLS